MKKIEIKDGKLWCPKCSQNKDLSEFYLSDGWPKRPCIECKGAYQSGYYEENLDAVEEYQQAYYQEHREEIIADQLKRDADRKDEITIYQAKYRQENKEELNAQRSLRQKKQRKEDPAFRLRGLVSNAIYQALREMGGSKMGISVFERLQYSKEQLAAHIESQFDWWMNWDNQGIYDQNTWNDNDPSTWTWQLDHIIPQSSLPFVSMEEENFKKVWDLQNLRPLSAKQNIFDGAKRIRHQ